MDSIILFFYRMKTFYVLSTEYQITAGRRSASAEDTVRWPERAVALNVRLRVRSDVAAHRHTVGQKAIIRRNGNEERSLTSGRTLQVMDLI